MKYILPNNEIITIPQGTKAKDHKLYLPLPPNIDFIKS